MVISNSVRAWLYLVPLIPSILVTIFNLYHFLSSRALRTAINNHVIILLLSFGLIFELTESVWTIYLYFTGSVPTTILAFCTAWAFISLVAQTSVSILMAWASMERHIIIFFPNWFATKTKRFLFHLLPLAVCILYPTIFYFVMYFIVPCNTAITSTFRLCNRYSCIISMPRVALFDGIASNIIPAFVTVIFSVALLLRVLYHRYRIRGRIDWRNYKKMAAQLLPISGLYIVLQLPQAIMFAGYSAGLRYTAAATSFYSDALFFSYWVVLFTPFACVVSLPDLKTKCRNLVLFWRRRHLVGPQTLTITHSKVAQRPIAPPSIR